MTFRDFLKLKFGYKDSEARIGLSVRQVGQAVSTPPTFDGFSREGYQKNVMVFRCISMIAQACAGIEIELYKKRNGAKPTEIENHELLSLLSNPNPMESGYAFTESFISYFLLTGNGMLEMTKLGGNKVYNTSKPVELWHVRPSAIKIIVGSRGYPKQYELVTNDVVRVWEFDQIKLKSNLVHMKTFNPTDLWWGQSPLQAAILALDQSNQSDKYNLALLQNSATPSGVLKVETSSVNPTGTLPPDKFAQLKADLELNYQGAVNRGRPMLLEGGLSWTQIGLSPTEMSFLENKKVTAADIATVFGVPLELLGLGQKTFNNYAEARCSFYEETVLPLMDSYLNKLNNTLTPLFGEGLELGINKDDIEALAYKREIKFKTVATADFLTINEKRQATGYEPLDGWDYLIIQGKPVLSPDELLETEVPEDEEMDDEEQDVENDDVENEEDKPKRAEWKSFNLVNKIERLSSWKKQNARREKISAQLASNVEDAFNDFSNKLKSILRKGGEKQLVELRIQEAQEQLRNDLEKPLSKAIKKTVIDFASNIFQGAKDAGLTYEVKKSSTRFDYWVSQYVKTRTATAITQIDGTTKRKVERIVKELVQDNMIDGSGAADLINELMDNFDTISKSRATTIARTEIGSASNNANLQAARDLQIPNLQKEWVSMDDDRTRDGGKNGLGPDHVAMNGKRVDIDDYFEVPPDTTMDSPHDPSAPPEQVIKCRCVLVFMAK